MIEGSFLLMKTFNINASCNTDIHYMADITPGLEIIKSMVDKGQPCQAVWKDNNITSA